MGRARGDMPGVLDPVATAKALLALIVAIQVLGRGVFESASLRTIAEQGKRLIGLNVSAPRSPASAN